VVGDVLHVRAVRRKPSESVRISFDRVYLVSAINLVDRGDFSLYASEEDMQRAILLEPSLLEPDLKPITYEKRVEPGFVDVYGIDGNGRLVVVELKRKTAGREAALQLARYVDSVRATVSREVRGVLVAPRLAKGVQRLLVSLGLEFKALDPKRCAEVLRRSETRRLAEFFGEP
jgi:RecB family endonuclease NucS